MFIDRFLIFNTAAVMVSVTVFMFTRDLTKAILAFPITFIILFGLVCLFTWIASLRYKKEEAAYDKYAKARGWKRQNSTVEEYKVWNNLKAYPGMTTEELYNKHGNESVKGLNKTGFESFMTFKGFQPNSLHFGQSSDGQWYIDDHDENIKRRAKVYKKMVLAS